MNIKNTRRGFTQIKRVGQAGPALQPCGAGCDNAPTKGHLATCIPPHPVSGHPLPQRARETTHGFTLIELLVVVLIIGILAAVAVPQYQKAVEKSAAAEALPILDSMYKAAQAYYLANGTWPTKFNQLDVELPWTGTEKWREEKHVITDTRSNDKWSLQIYHESAVGDAFYLGRISGKYTGSGFRKDLLSGNLACMEKKSEGYIFDGNPGDYCVKLFHAQTPPLTYNNGRIYQMP